MRYKALVFAAGKSTRFQGIKQLAKISGSTLIESSYQEVEKSDIEDTLLILGSYKSQILSEINIDISNVGFVERADLGFGVSISESIAKYVVNQSDARAVSHVLITLADQVALKRKHFNQLKLASITHPDKIICCLTSDGICSPVIFPKGYFNALCQLQGDKGAKSIVMENLENIVKISIDEAAIDIDTQEDFLRWQQAKIPPNTLHNKRPIGATIDD